MKYDQEDFLKKFEDIRKPNSMVWNPKTFKWTNIEDEANNSEADLSPLELSNKQEIEEGLNKSWGNLKERVFKCMDLFMSEDDRTLLKAFINIGKSFNDLWRYIPYDWHTQLFIIEFFSDLDQ